ncbi:unnamed protein product [Urochloa decumbens]|uniref:HMA domain-containing protein n=1 Tax=Urochloa decumbens TaxID=240449 RepID=A0ABC9HCY7_9POAL
MTTKDSTLIIEVDLQCEKCFKKIQKVLCKLQSKEEDIRKIDYDNAKNTVTISGPFNAAKLSKKLRCKACEVIKDIKIKPQEEKKPEAKKSEEKKPEAKKPEEKKPAEEKKKPEEKKPAEEKKKPAEEKKKPEEKKGDDEKAKASPASSTTTVNLQFTNICSICYPWPCSDPAHWGIHHPQQMMMPQWPPCGGIMAAPPVPAPAPPPLPAPVHHPPHPPCGAGAPQKWAPCGGPSFCGGCGWCHGGGGGMHGWAAAPAAAMCCPGPSLCRGCNGCKIVHETKFSYEEYPSSACAVM